MSALNRIVVGMAGNWVGIGLTFAQRLVIVPVVLSAWTAQQYGFYLALAAAIALLTLPGRSFENVINRELLRIGGDLPDLLRGLHGGGVMVAIPLEAALALLTYCLLRLGVFLGPEALSLVAGKEALLAAGIFVSRALNAFPGATYSQVLSCYGYYPKLIWLGLVGRVLAVIIPCVGALVGLGPVGVTLLDLIAPCLFTIPAWLILRRWAIRCGVWGWRPEIRPAFRIFVSSLQNLLAEIVMMMRGDGLRLILASTVGGPALTAFVTMRTGANLALQGLGTVTSPMMPEMMRYLRDRDQQKVEASFSALWLPLIILMCPAVLLLQLGITPLFEIWTRGKVQFDPLLFALLSSGVLFNAVAQPAIAVVVGNNLLRPQLVISCIVTVVALGGVFALTPMFGIVGAAGGLLAGELVLVCAYTSCAKRWLQDNNLSWPTRSLWAVTLVAVVVTLALVGLALAELIPARELFKVKVIATATVFGSVVLASWRVIKSLPGEARNRIFRIFRLV